MLSGQYYCLYSRYFVIVVLYRNLRFAVGAQVIEDTLFSHLSKSCGKLMRKVDRHRHKRRRLLASIAEHHTLVTCADKVVFIVSFSLVFERAVHAHSYVGRLLVKAYDNLALVAI